MCLGVPGRIVSIRRNEDGLPTGTVSFGGIRKEVCLAYVPDATAGEYVIVHVGFAISKVDEEEARAVFRLLDELGQLSELDETATDTT
ncbi:MAG: HypC/HybG/HupF family hydrogenase formation chaperone [Acidobacteriota bacterium]|nr:HypC/HybG/HupF family hydrogenase formation chaperone [Acidobacteriota bacterium]